MSEQKTASAFFDFLKKRGGDFGRPQSPGEQREFFGQDTLDEFLSGKSYLLVQSSFAQAARYSLEKEVLELTYQDGHTACYTGVPMDVGKSFAAAGSKGTWLHDNLKLGYNPDGTWVHAYDYHPDKRLEDF